MGYPVLTTSSLMRLLMAARLVTMALLIHGVVQAAEDQQVLEVFVRDGCSHCAAAKEFLPRFAGQHPGLQIVLRPVDNDAAALEDLLQYSRNAGIWPPGVPTFVIGNKVLAGFESAERTAEILASMIGQSTEVSRSITTELPGTLNVHRLGLPLFSLTLGLIDGFNPCAMWVLLFLLALLVHLHDRKRMALIAGTFVLVSGAVYYAFMAAWLNLFLLVGAATILYQVLGGVALIIGVINIKDFLNPGEGFSLRIPVSAKPGLYARMRAIIEANSLLASITGVTVLAVMVNFIELLCTAGIPAIYTAVLSQQDPGPMAYYAWLGLYIIGYMADDTLMVTLAVITLSNRKLSERAGRLLKLVSGLVMLTLGGIMLLHLDWLV
jgi:hypothetical protein